MKVQHRLQSAEGNNEHGYLVDLIGPLTEGSWCSLCIGMSACTACIVTWNLDGCDNATAFLDSATEHAWTETRHALASNWVVNTRYPGCSAASPRHVTHHQVCARQWLLCELVSSMMYGTKMGPAQQAAVWRECLTAAVSGGPAFSNTQAAMIVVDPDSQDVDGLTDNEELQRGQLQQ